MRHSPTPWVAGNVRAELARQRRSARSIALALGYKPSNFHRRVAGQYPFNIEELIAVAALLDVPVTQFIEPPATQASA